MTNKTFTPFPVLQTERLLLRQLRSGDDKEIFALRSNENVNKYLGRKGSQSINDAKNFIQTINEKSRNNDGVYWAITLTDSDELIGTVCLFNIPEDYSKAEIGYELLPRFQGKGFMQEAVSEVIRFAFQQLGVRAIEACTHAHNQRSTLLLEKLNFAKGSALDENGELFQWNLRN